MGIGVVLFGGCSDGYKSYDVPDMDSTADKGKKLDGWLGGLLSSRLGAVRGETDMTLPKKQIGLTLQQTMRAVINNNLRIKAQAHEPVIAKESVNVERSVYDTEAFGSAGTNYYEDGSESGNGGFTPYRKQTLTGQAGFRKYLSTGTEITVSGKATGGDRKYEGYSWESKSNQGAVVTLRQSLLKGFMAKDTRSKIEIAAYNTKISVSELNLEVSNALVETSDAYWDLWLTDRQIETAEEIMQMAQKVLESEEVKASKGLSSESDLNRARSTVAFRQAELIRAKGNRKAAVEQLLQLINIDSDSKDIKGIHLVAVDQPLNEEFSFEQKTAINNALKNRPEMISARLKEKSALSKLAATGNSLLPKLDLELSGEQNVEDYSSSINDDSGGRNVGAKLEMSFPLGNTQAKAEDTIARAEYAQAKDSAAYTRSSIVSEVRVTLSNTAVSIREAHQYEKAWKAMVKVVEGVEARYVLGQVNNDDLLREQSNLGQAKMDYYSSLGEYNKNLMQMLHVQGLLLENH